jgi:hypothetical protein
MVPGNDGVEWARLFCEWVKSHRVKWGAPDQTVILFVDSAQTRGNLEALEIFRQHNVLVITFPPHPTHVLQPVDEAWARPFKAHMPPRLPSLEPASSNGFFPLAVGFDGRRPVADDDPPRTDCGGCRRRRSERHDALSVRDGLT